MPKKTRTARFSRTMSLSARRPTRAPALDFGTVVILSTIKRQSARNPLVSVRLDQESKKRSIGWIGGERANGKGIRHVEAVVLKNHNWTRFPCVGLAASNSANLTALHVSSGSETACNLSQHPADLHPCVTTTKTARVDRDIDFLIWALKSRKHLRCNSAGLALELELQI